MKYSDPLRFLAASPSLIGRRMARYVLLLTLMLSGCRLDMQVQPRYDPYSASTFFSDGRSERQPVEGTVSRSEIEDSPGAAIVTGANGSAANAFPIPITREVLERGRQRFDIFCAPCHGLAGDGDGIIVQRGFKHPPSYHIDRLRAASTGHFFSVITDGFGSMYPYGYRVTPSDRWAIIAYIRALQLSRQATIQDVPPEERQRLLSAAP